MRSVPAILALLVFRAACCCAQTPSCSLDSEGNQVCVRTVADSNVCGRPIGPLGGGTFMPIYCADIEVDKVSQDGRTIFKLVLGGESDDRPAQFFFDARQNVVLLGTTYSTKFPIAPDAIQNHYAGPAPTIYEGSGPHGTPTVDRRHPERRRHSEQYRSSGALGLDDRAARN